MEDKPINMRSLMRNKFGKSKRGPGPSDCAGVIEVDLAALAKNYRTLAENADPALCAAAVKANAYGLGVERVAPCLWEQGCRDYFVATLDEGIALRNILRKASIFVLNGLLEGQERSFDDKKLVPVLNDLGQIEIWRRYCKDHETALPCVVQFDTGMNRLGLTAADAERLVERPEFLSGITVQGIMSHLACGSDPSHPLNEAQRLAFDRIRSEYPDISASLANSAGVFLGRPFHFDMVRVGIALYGGNPLDGERHGIEPVVRVRSRILQERVVEAGATVGYNATHTAETRTRLITASAGYADGVSTRLSNTGFVVIDGQRAPIVGRVSMDLITVDVTDVPEEKTKPGGYVDLVGPGLSLDETAATGGLIPYEILTGLSSRFERRYVEDIPD